MFSIELLREAMAELPGSKPSARVTIGRPPKCDVIDGGLRTPTSQVPARTIQRKENKSILFCDTETEILRPARGGPNAFTVTQVGKQMATIHLKCMLERLQE